jgi:hypothetical protein
MQHTVTVQVVAVLVVCILFLSLFLVVIDFPALLLVMQASLIQDPSFFVPSATTAHLITSNVLQLYNLCILLSIQLYTIKPWSR